MLSPKAGPLLGGVRGRQSICGLPTWGNTWPWWGWGRCYPETAEPPGLAAAGVPAGSGARRGGRRREGERRSDRRGRKMGREIRVDARGARVRERAAAVVTGGGRVLSLGGRRPLAFPDPRPWRLGRRSDPLPEFQSCTLSRSLPPCSSPATPIFQIPSRVPDGPLPRSLFLPGLHFTFSAFRALPTAFSCPLRLRSS